MSFEMEEIDLAVVISLLKTNDFAKSVIHTRLNKMPRAASIYVKM